MIDPHAYNVTVRRRDIEGDLCFEVIVKELPEIAAYGETFDEAYELAIQAIEAAAEYFSDKNKVMPVPYDVVDDYSGRVTLRIPKYLHKSLAEAAESEEISLNQYLVSVLSYHSGYANNYKNEIIADHLHSGEAEIGWYKGVVPNFQNFQIGERRADYDRRKETVDEIIDIRIESCLASKLVN